MRLQTKALLGIGAILVASLGLRSLQAHRAEVDLATDEAHRQARDLGNFLAATLDHLSQEMVDGRVPLNEHTIALLPPVATTRIWQRFRNLSPNGLYFNVVSDRASEAKNRADPMERAAIQQFRANPDLKEIFTSHTGHDGSFYYYACPLVVERSCLFCHGDPDQVAGRFDQRYGQVTGYHEGEVRGIISIKLPPEPIQARTAALFHRDLAFEGLAFCAIFALLVVLIRNLFTGPIGRLAHGLEGVAAGNYDVRLAEYGSDEATAVSHAFNHMVEEITRQQTALRESAVEVRQLATAIDQLAESVFITDADFNIDYVNPAFETLTGYSRAEAVGKTPWVLKRGEHDAAFYGGIRRTISEGQSWKGTCKGLRKDGSELVEAVLFSPIRDESDAISRYVAVSTDVTQQRRMEEQLWRAQKLEALGQLAGGIAHDFNNLLTGILGNLNVAQVESSEPKVIRPLRQAEQAAIRSAHLVAQLLAFSRESQMVFQPTDINALFREVHALVSRTIDRRIDLELDLAPDLPLVMADASQIHSVLMNLCVNARDAITEVLHGTTLPERRHDAFVITLATRLAPITEEECPADLDAPAGPYVVVSVTDNGAGIAPDHRDHLFEPFFTTKEIGRGTGLGLASAFGIVRQHRGWIDVDSAAGRGTTFTVSLPASASPVRPDAHRTLPTAAQGGSETILMIDDEEIIRDLGRTILGRYGYTVLAAADGAEGLALFARERDHIDLVVLDLSMPHMSGTEVMEALRAIDPDVRVLLSSGYAAEGLPTGLGSLPFVAKPYRISELARAVRDVLDGPPAAVPD